MKRLVSCSSETCFLVMIRNDANAVGLHLFDKSSVLVIRARLRSQQYRIPEHSIIPEEEQHRRPKDTEI